LKNNKQRAKKESGTKLCSLLTIDWTQAGKKRWGNVGDQKKTKRPYCSQEAERDGHWGNENSREKNAKVKKYGFHKQKRGEKEFPLDNN